MAFESDTTIVNSDDENVAMLGLESSDLGPKDFVNPFLLVQSTPMFVEGATGVGVSGSPKKARRKRKGEANINGKEKKDKKVQNESDKLENKDKKVKSKPIVFPNFWAAAPGFPAITAAEQQPGEVNQGSNLLEDLALILEKHKIVGQPAEDINKLIQTAIGQICALRSSVHNMESRLSKLEENQGSSAKTYAEIAKDQSQSPKTNKKSTKSSASKELKSATTVNEPNTTLNKTETKVTAAQAVAKSSQVQKQAKQPPRQPENLKPKPVVPTLIVKPTTEGSNYKELKSTLESKINLKPLGVKVLSCAPSAGNGVIIRVQTSDMLETLQKSINDHSELKNVCQARTPKGRNPQIIVYDIAPSGEPREDEEKNFLESLRSSNDLPCGEMKVIFRRKGRGNL
ncbi:hypothetical protein AVEN_225828-1 [Araneus ventricosus]|uniref:Uncharacterized protein n=1 Tax=Araneus ventricosus TaxID=182803 RepID=A0A4Y2BCT1_ARAVE|nr:hypothetical protein AVEN_225828-1 [Araneus ventricosus]